MHAHGQFLSDHAQVLIFSLCLSTTHCIFNNGAGIILWHVMFLPSLSLYRPYAWTSRLHNNDAMLGVKTCRAAHTCCAGRALALSASQSVRVGPGRPGGMACRGWPAGCMLGDGARDSASFDPQHAGAPFCDVICIRSIQVIVFLLFSV